MGAANSKVEDDKALSLCRERKRFVKQAIQERCLLAEAHFAYIQSLRNTGIALRKFVEHDAQAEPSVYMSTSATPEPRELTDKFISQLSNSSLSPSHRLVTSDSPIPSPLSSGRYHINHMKVSSTSSTIIKEKPPISLTATVHNSSVTQRSPVAQSDENSSLDSPATPHGTPPWDYFGLFHPINNELSFDNERGLNHGVDPTDDINRVRDEEGIPDLEEEGERASTIEDDDDFDTEDDFDQTSTEPLVRMFKNRNVAAEQQLENKSPTLTNPSHNEKNVAIVQTSTEPLVRMVKNQNVAAEQLLENKAPALTNPQNSEKNVANSSVPEIDETSEIITPRKTPSFVSLPNGNANVTSEIKLRTKDFVSCMKENENLFLRASDAGKEVARMLEANKVQFRPLVPEDIARRSRKPGFLTAFLVCCGEETPQPHAAAVSVNNEVKLLQWPSSVPSQSSSFREPPSVTSRDDIEDLSSDILHNVCMNSGSHASTLDRLYAWERKLCDEVKESVKIRKEYELKCKLLRHQESSGEAPFKIDKTRAIVKDLHCRIRVAIQRINSISQRIEEIRDKELQPQLEELMEGLLKMWRIMLDCHKHQYNIISLACNSGNRKVTISSEMQLLVTGLLEFELNSLCSNFTKWISAHKSYLSAINGWLLKCIIPVTRQKSSRKKQPQPLSPSRDGAPPIFITCRNWLKLLNDLPATEVTDSIKDMVAMLNRSLPAQGNAGSNLKFSMSRKAQKDEEKENSQTGLNVDWSRNYDSLQSGLVIFLDRLKTFAELSVLKYEELKMSVSVAHITYQK